MKVFYSILIGIAIAVVLFLSGFFTCKYINHSEPVELVKYDTVYIKGDTIKRVIKEPVPYTVHDTVVEPVDTAQLFAIWKDYHLRRQYKLDFSNDTIGTFVVDATVNENKLVKSDATIQPIKQVITKTEDVNKVTFIRGYVLLGTSVHNFNTQKVTLGAQFVERFNVGVTAIRYNSDFTYTVDFGIMFP